MPNKRYTGDFFASLRYVEQKNQLLRAQQNQDGDPDILVPFTVTVYLFLAKIGLAILFLLRANMVGVSNFGGGKNE